MTEEKKEQIPEPEEVPDEKKTSSGEPLNSFSRHFLDSDARTTGGISSSEHTSDFKSEAEESEEKPDVFIDEPDEIQVSEAEEEYERTESYDKSTNIQQQSNDERGSAIKGLISFFTIFRSDVGPKETDAMERNFHLAPVIGAIFAMILILEIVIFYILDYLVDFPMSSIFAITALATVLIGSKFLHFDGLVDFGDGMVASGDREKHVRAMRDSNIGAGGFGVALIVTLGTFAIYMNLSIMFIPLLFIIPAAEIFIKNSMVSAAAHGTPGDGMSASQVRNTNNSTVNKSIIISFIAAFIVLIISIVIVALIEIIITKAVRSDLLVIAASMFFALLAGLAVSIYAGKFISKTADKTFGFTSGDTLGATNEITRPVLAAVMLLVFLIIFEILIRI